MKSACSLNKNISVFKIIIYCINIIQIRYVYFYYTDLQVETLIKNIKHQ